MNWVCRCTVVRNWTWVYGGFVAIDGETSQSSSLGLRRKHSCWGNLEYDNTWIRLGILSVRMNLHGTWEYLQIQQSLASRHVAIDLRVVDVLDVWVLELLPFVVLHNLRLPSLPDLRPLRYLRVHCINVHSGHTPILNLVESFLFTCSGVDARLLGHDLSYNLVLLRVILEKVQSHWAISLSCHGVADRFVVRRSPVTDANQRCNHVWFRRTII